MTFDGRHPLKEDDLLWKTNFDGRYLVESSEQGEAEELGTNGQERGWISVR